jgi:hypothetical protein
MMVAVSPKFDLEWFLDGRRKRPELDEEIAGESAVTVHPWRRRTVVSIPREVPAPCEDEVLRQVGFDQLQTA